MEFANPNKPTGQTSIPSKSHSVDIKGIPTNLLAQRFKDRLVLIITQCDSFGSILNVSKDDVAYLTNPESDIALSFQFLLGVEDKLYKVLAKKIGETVFQEMGISAVTLTLALKDKSPETFRAIMNGLEQIDVWSVV